jgi:hypothetical protein
MSLDELILKELGLQLYTRLRVQAQLEEVKARLADSNALLIKVRDEHSGTAENLSGQVRDDAQPGGTPGSDGE